MLLLSAAVAAVTRPSSCYDSFGRLRNADAMHHPSAMSEYWLSDGGCVDRIPKDETNANDPRKRYVSNTQNRFINLLSFYLLNHSIYFNGKTKGNKESKWWRFTWFDVSAHWFLRPWITQETWNFSFSVDCWVSLDWWNTFGWIWSRQNG